MCVNILNNQRKRTEGVFLADQCDSVHIDVGIQSINRHVAQSTPDDLSNGPTFERHGAFPALKSPIHSQGVEAKARNLIIYTGKFDAKAQPH